MESVGPRKKTITYPPWTDEKPELYSVDDIVGALAMWAIRQSPYPMPEGLEAACSTLSIDLVEIWDEREAELGFLDLSVKDVEEMLLAAFKTNISIERWNERKNGREGMGFSSRYDKPSPDDDFIDLHALARNVAHSLKAERVIDRD